MTDPTLASASLAALQARCDDAVAAVEDAKRCLVKTNDIWQAREAAFTSLNAAQLDVRELKHDLQPHIDREQALQAENARLRSAHASLAGLIENRARVAVLQVQYQGDHYKPTPYEANLLVNMRHILRQFAADLGLTETSETPPPPARQETGE